MYEGLKQDLPVDENPETDYHVNPIEGNASSIAYGLYCKLINYENHYNHIQNKYKSLACTWVVATFIGIGYLLSGKEVLLPININLVVILLCLLSSEGIFLLWFLDSGVYFKLIESIFVEGYKLEEKYPFLGKYHHTILRLHKESIDPLRFQGFYYFSFILFMLIMAVISFSFYLVMLEKFYLLIILSMLIVGFFLISIFHKKPFLFRKK